MTSRDRVDAALRGNAPDRVPVGPYVGSAAAALVGASPRDYYTRGEVIARAQRALWKAVGHDIAVTAADTYYIAEAFGLRTVHHEDALPTAAQPLLDSLDQVDALRVPDPETGGRMPVYLKALEELKGLLGDRVVLRGTGTGPFSLAAYLFGEQEFLMRLMEIAVGERGDVDRGRIHRLLEITSDATAAFLLAQVDRGVDLAYVGDSLASADVISPAMYREYALPYHQKVFAAVKDRARGRGVYTLLHICGDNTPALAEFAKSGADLIEIDHKMDLARCREILGPRIAMIGNLDPVRTLLQGAVATVFEASLAAIRAARGQEGGFILGSGCFVPVGTPVENLIQMVEASRQAAQGGRPSPVRGDWRSRKEPSH